MIEITPPNKEYSIKLDDKRKLGMAEYGDPNGLPVLWFAGTPGARTQVPDSSRTYAMDNNFWIICIERPGIGLSTPHLHDEVLDWTSDIEQVLDRLKIKNFALIGLSGGGPYALACAHEFKERVIATAIFGGVAPTLGDEAPAGGLTAKAIPAEPLLSKIHKPLGGLLSKAVRALHPVANPVFDLLINNIELTETQFLRRPEMKAMFLSDVLNGSKGGLNSIFHDIILFSREWGFSLKEIETPVHFWHGTADPLVPHEHAVSMAATIPDGRVTIREDEGHLSGLDYVIDALNYINGARKAS